MPRQIIKKWIDYGNRDRVPKKAVLEHENISASTVWRWQRNPEINFPMFDKIGGLDSIIKQRVCDWDDLQEQKAREKVAA